MTYARAALFSLLILTGFFISSAQVSAQEADSSANKVCADWWAANKDKPQAMITPPKCQQNVPCNGSIGVIAGRCVQDKCKASTACGKPLEGKPQQDVNQGAQAGQQGSQSGPSDSKFDAMQRDDFNNDSLMKNLLRSFENPNGPPQMLVPANQGELQSLQQAQQISNNVLREVTGLSVAPQDTVFGQLQSYLQNPATVQLPEGWSFSPSANGGAAFTANPVPTPSAFTPGPATTFNSSIDLPRPSTSGIGSALSNAWQGVKDFASAQWEKVMSVLNGQGAIEMPPVVMNQQEYDIANTPIEEISPVTDIPEVPTQDTQLTEDILRSLASGEATSQARTGLANQVVDALNTGAWQPSIQELEIARSVLESSPDDRGFLTRFADNLGLRVSDRAQALGAVNDALTAQVRAQSLAYLQNNTANIDPRYLSSIDITNPINASGVGRESGILPINDANYGRESESRTPLNTLANIDPRYTDPAYTVPRILDSLAQESLPTAQDQLSAAGEKVVAAAQNVDDAYRQIGFEKQSMNPAGNGAILSRTDQYVPTKLQELQNDAQAKLETFEDFRDAAGTQGPDGKWSFSPQDLTDARTLLNDAQEAQDAVQAEAQRLQQQLDTVVGPAKAELHDAIDAYNTRLSDLTDRLKDPTRIVQDTAYAFRSVADSSDLFARQAQIQLDEKSASRPWYDRWLGTGYVEENGVRQPFADYQKTVEASIAAAHADAARYNKLADAVASGELPAEVVSALGKEPLSTSGGNIRQQVLQDQVLKYYDAVRARQNEEAFLKTASQEEIDNYYEYYGAESLNRAEIEQDSLAAINRLASDAPLTDLEASVARQLAGNTTFSEDLREGINNLLGKVAPQSMGDVLRNPVTLLTGIPQSMFDHAVNTFSDGLLSAQLERLTMSPSEILSDRLINGGLLAVDAATLVSPAKILGLSEGGLVGETAARTTFSPAFIERLSGAEARAASIYASRAEESTLAELATKNITPAEFESRAYTRLYENLSKTDIVANGGGDSIMNALRTEMETKGIVPPSGFSPITGRAESISDITTAIASDRALVPYEPPVSLGNDIPRAADIAPLPQEASSGLIQRVADNLSAQFPRAAQYLGIRPIEPAVNTSASIAARLAEGDIILQESVSDIAGGSGANIPAGNGSSPVAPVSAQFSRTAQALQDIRNAAYSNPVAPVAKVASALALDTKDGIVRAFGGTPSVPTAPPPVSEAVTTLQQEGRAVGADISVIESAPSAPPASLDYNGIDQLPRAEGQINPVQAMDFAAEAAAEWLNRPTITEAKAADGNPLTTAERSNLRARLEETQPSAYVLYESNKLRTNSITALQSAMDTLDASLAKFPPGNPTVDRIRALYDPALFRSGRAYDSLPLSEKLDIAAKLDNLSREYLSIVSRPAAVATPAPAAPAGGSLSRQIANLGRSAALGLSILLGPIPDIPVLDTFFSTASQASEASRRGMSSQAQAGLVGKEQQVTASFYGSPGDRTAGSEVTSSGAIYDPDGYSIAHKTLRLGTRVLLSDGVHSPVVARVTNRGPFVAGRDVDLSFQTAKHFESVDAGVVQLKMTVLDDPADSLAYSYEKGRTDFNDGAVVTADAAQRLVAEARGITAAAETKIATAPSVPALQPVVYRSSDVASSAEPQTFSFANAPLKGGETLIYVPADFTPAGAKLYVYYHGQGGSIADALGRQEILDQFKASGITNGVLVVPELASNVGAAGQATEFSKRGVASAFFDEVGSRAARMAGLDAGALQDARVVEIAYSGGFDPAREVLASDAASRVDGVILMDAGYGVGSFAQWANANPSKFLVSAYTGSTAAKNHTLAQLLTSPQNALPARIGAGTRAVFASAGSHTNFVEAAWKTQPVADILSRLTSETPAVANATPETTPAESASPPEDRAAANAAMQEALATPPVEEGTVAYIDTAARLVAPGGISVKLNNGTVLKIPIEYKIQPTGYRPTATSPVEPYRYIIEHYTDAIAPVDSMVNSMHTTECAGRPACAKYGAHFVIGCTATSCRIVQAYPLIDDPLVPNAIDARANQVSSPGTRNRRDAASPISNGNAIGVELIHNTADGAPSALETQVAVALTNAIQDAADIPLSNVVSHYPLDHKAVGEGVAVQKAVVASGHQPGGAAVAAAPEPSFMESAWGALKSIGDSFAELPKYGRAFPRETPTTGTTDMDRALEDARQAALSRAAAEESTKPVPLINADQMPAARPSPADANDYAVQVAALAKQVYPQATASQIAAQVYFAGLDYSQTFRTLRDDLAKTYLKNKNQAVTAAARAKANLAIAKDVAALVRSPATPRIVSYGAREAAQGAVDGYLFDAYTRMPKVDSTGDFTYKDIAAALQMGVSLRDYTIGGVDPTFKMNLYFMGRAMDEAGLQWGITSAFRDNYRQSLITAGTRARVGNSYHGGSRVTEGYGHGLAFDITGYGKTSGSAVYAYVDAHGLEYGIGRPYRAGDPPHIGPVASREYTSRRGRPNVNYTAIASAQLKELAAAGDAARPEPFAAPAIAQAAGMRVSPISIARLNPIEDPLAGFGITLASNSGIASPFTVADVRTQVIASTPSEVLAADPGGLIPVADEVPPEILAAALPENVPAAEPLPLDTAAPVIEPLPLAVPAIEEIAVHTPLSVAARDDSGTVLEPSPFAVVVKASDVSVSPAAETPAGQGGAVAENPAPSLSAGGDASALRALLQKAEATLTASRTAITNSWNKLASRRQAIMRAQQVGGLSGLDILKRTSPGVKADAATLASAAEQLADDPLVSSADREVLRTQAARLRSSTAALDAEVQNFARQSYVTMYMQSDAFKAAVTRQGTAAKQAASAIKNTAEDAGAPVSLTETLNASPLIELIDPILVAAESPAPLQVPVITQDTPFQVTVTVTRVRSAPEPASPVSAPVQEPVGPAPAPIVGFLGRLRENIVRGFADIGAAQREALTPGTVSSPPEIDLALAQAQARAATAARNMEELARVLRELPESPDALAARSASDDIESVAAQSQKAAQELEAAQAEAAKGTAEGDAAARGLVARSQSDAAGADAAAERAATAIAQTSVPFKDRMISLLEESKLGARSGAGGANGAGGGGTAGDAGGTNGWGSTAAGVGKKILATACGGRIRAAVCGAVGLGAYIGMDSSSTPDTGSTAKPAPGSQTNTEGVVTSVPPDGAGGTQASGGDAPAAGGGKTGAGGSETPESKSPNGGSTSGAGAPDSGGQTGPGYSPTFGGAPVAPPAGSVTTGGSGFTRGGISLLSTLLQGLVSLFRGEEAPAQSAPQTEPSQPSQSAVGTITANPSLIDAGETTELAWSSVGTDTGSTTCAVVSANFSVIIRGPQDGSFRSPELAESTRFGLVCNLHGAKDKLLNETLVRVRGDDADPAPIFTPEQISASQGLGAGAGTGTATNAGTTGIPVNAGQSDGVNGSPAPQDVRTCDPQQPMDSFIRCLCEAEPNTNGCSIPPGGLH